MSAYRLVSLTGPGGVGKTALALKVARSIAGEFADGGWLVELASLADPAHVPAAVAGALRLAVSPNNITPGAIAGAIGDKKLLLVLDNCEHFIGAVASLTETLIAFCAHITIVTTTREALRIQGEHVWRVPSLDVPAAEHRDAAAILAHSAAELFIAKTREFGTNLAPDINDARAIATICRHLDGIPDAVLRCRGIGRCAQRLIGASNC
jgi:predicted ATPase